MHMLYMDAHAHDCVDIYTKTTTTHLNHLRTPLTAYLPLLSGIVLARQSFAANSGAAASALSRYTAGREWSKEAVAIWGHY